MEPSDLPAEFSEMNWSPGTSMASIIDVESALGVELPPVYKAFLQCHNGAEGSPGPNAYVQIWPIEEIVSLNLGYEFEAGVPGFLAFAGDGGGEAYGFDTRSPSWPIVMVPYIGMQWEVAIPICVSFDSFFAALRDANV